MNFSGTLTVVGILVPFVSKRPRSRTERCHFPWSQAGNRRVPPEAELAEGGGNRDVGSARVYGEVLPVQGVLGTTPVGGRTEARVTPGAGPGGRILGVQRSARVRLLVRDQGSVRRAGAGDARLPTRLPEDLVTAEEGQVDAGIARRLHVDELVAGPVFIVSDG